MIHSICTFTVSGLKAFKLSVFSVKLRGCFKIFLLVFTTSLNWGGAGVLGLSVEFCWSVWLPLADSISSYIIELNIRFRSWQLKALLPFCHSFLPHLKDVNKGLKGMRLDFPHKLMLPCLIYRFWDFHGLKCQELVLLISHPTYEPTQSSTYTCKKKFMFITC